jgi:hypothetical protein
VVCTRDRASRLAITLEYYERLQFANPWELVVVINASTDATLDVVERFRSETRLRILVLHEPRPGLCTARNAGWQASHGEIVVFADDDCYPAGDFLSQILACFDEANLGYLGGRMLRFDSTDQPVTIQTLESRVDLAPRSVIRTGLIHGGNMAFQRAVLEEIGGFDEWLGAGTRVRSGGDVDALSRASVAGFPGAYDPRPIVYHHHGRKTAEDEESVMAGYDLGRGAFFVKCLLDRRRRRLYAWPIFRRIAGHLVKRRFGVMRAELQGGLIYLRHVLGAKQHR